MTARPKTILHIGLHKCGSTWLQNNIFANADYGLCIPWGGMSHAAVTEFVSVDPLTFDAKATLKKFDAALTTAVNSDGPCIVSHEALSSRPHLGSYYAPAVAHRLKAVFPDAKPLVIFREQSKMLYSLYGEHVRNGGRYTLQEFLGTGDEPEGWAPMCHLSFFEYHRLIALYQELFGADNVLALPLEWMSTAPQEFLKRLFAHFELPLPPDLKIERRSNAGWGAFTSEAYRLTNGLFRRNPLGPQQSVAFRARQFIAWRLDRVVPTALNNHLAARRRRIILERIGDMYHPSNAQLSRMVDIDLTALGYS